jgi:GDPmannose 4,6-dehydratase
MFSVRKFIEKAFEMRGIFISWKNSGVDEVGYDATSGKEYVFIDPKYFRPAEVELLLGDPTKAKETLGWEPKIKFDELVKRMMDNDCPTRIVG